MKRARKTEMSLKVDAVVGEQIRHFRTDRGLTLSTLSQAVDLGSRQLQKYESASQQVSASKLYEIAKILDVPIDAFFEDAEDIEAIPAPEMDSDARRLIDDFQKIDEHRVRLVISRLVKCLSQRGV